MTTVDATDLCAGSYARGCRCQGCLDMREARIKRLTAGVGAVPFEPTRDTIATLKESGLTWMQLEALVGVDKVTLQNLSAPGRQFVTQDLAERVDAAARAVARHPAPLTIAATMVDAKFARWMVLSLMARGWPSLWIGQQLGWEGTRCTPRDLNRARVHIEFEAKIRIVFDAHHYKDGPSRQAALKAWRQGRFPSDCYEWEDGDFRPIPGSLHPDVVKAAATFNLPHAGKVAQGKVKGVKVFADMASWGQWPSERCARTSMKNWAEATGRFFDDDYTDIALRPGRSLWCRNKHHDHGLPVVWR